VDGAVEEINCGWQSSTTLALGVQWSTTIIIAGSSAVARPEIT
jgi:hypothetical protein